MNKPAAFGFYLKAAEQGDADAQFRLGEMYRNGQGVEKDLKSASEWLRKAASQGNENARRNLAEINGAAG
jgi:TPR repeat protein